VEGRNENFKQGEDTMSYSTRQIDTPIGRLTLAASERGLCSIDFEGKSNNAEAGSRAEDLRPDADSERNLRRAEAALLSYFAGEMAALDGIPLDFSGTPFQRKVWTALRRIPAGKTCAYSDIAREIGNPRAVRAVGTANGANPIPIIVPCHRVIGADGSLTGYGGGLDRKEWLLRHEGVVPPPKGGRSPQGRLFL
jgi:methylated-DNA-[protein]-cysteine S-methyltransferase